MNTSVFERYPQLKTLRGNIPDAIVESNVRPKADAHESIRARAERSIPTSRLADIFPVELEQCPIHLERFLGRWGNVNIEEICKISLIARWLRPQTIFEFGTFNGMTTLQMALNAPENATVFTLDIAPDTARSMPMDLIDRYLAEKSGAFSLDVGHYFQGSPQASKINQLWGNSLSFDFSPYKNSVDLIFIDAGHTYECVKSDTENALKMLKPRGVILWHDYMSVLCPDVTRCLSEYAEQGLPINNLRNTTLSVYFRQS